MEVKCRLSEIPGKAAILVGRHRIEIEPRVIYRTNTDALRAFLEKQCAGLTSNQPNGDLTVVETLVLSLVQHYTSCYWLKSLDYASLSGISGLAWLDESTWNKFRATLDLSDTISTDHVGELVGRIHRLRVQQPSKTSHLQIICFGFDEGSSALKLSLSSYHPTTTYYLWYDKIKKSFDAIACLSEFYQDTASYWEYLVLRVENCFDHFFKIKFADLSDEALGIRFDQLNDEVKLIENTFDSFKQQFKKWEIGDEFHHIVLDMENCILSPDQDSKDSAPAWCDQLWQVMARCLARQIEQAFIDQKRKIEMKRRDTNEEVDKILENVERLNSKIAKSRQLIHQIDRRAAEELKMLEKLAWNQLLLDLANPAFVPDYNLACQRRNHEIYKEKNASLLAVKVFDLIHHPSTANREKRTMLENYLTNQSNKNEVMQKLHSALNKFIGREIINGITRNHVLTIDGEASVVLKKIASSVKLGGCREIVIKAERVIYLDCDWKVPGISVTLTAPLIHVCSPGVEKWTIDTSGRDGKEHEHLKADDGNGAGGSGNHGLAGQDGEDAGNVNICCQDFKGFLKIVARGGKGADGQDGGKGQPGSKGYDGRDGVIPRDREEGYNWYTLGAARGITNMVYSDSGWPGKGGGDGGSGGNGGKGGQGGLSGQVKFVSSHHRSTDSSQFILQDCASGKDGNDGQPGRGAAGGSGGKDGLDAFLYFEPNDNRPHFWNTGYWRSHMGSRTDLEIARWGGYGCNYRIIGHKIRSNSSRRHQAREGKRGTEGQRAACCQQQRQRSSNTAADQTASQFHSHHHQTGSDEYDRERKRQSEARRRDEREKAKERESINRMSREVAGERNAVSRHEGALAADRKRLERMDEIRQRVQAKIQETFEQRIAHQSVVGQRITRQMKLNFDDENLLGLIPASRIPTNLVRNVRSGRPVYGESTAALRCSAEVDALVMSIMMNKGDGSNLLTLKIPYTVQSLVLKLKFDEHEKEWESIEKIVSKVTKTSHPLKLADSLEFIASHLPLIISLADQSPASCNLIGILLAFLASTGHEVAEKNAVWILHEFHQRPIQVQQVIVLLGCISDWTHQSHILLGLFLENWILTNITKTIFGAIGNKELRQPRANLFTEVWLKCSPVSKWTKSAALSLDAENEWLKHVSQFVQVLRHENSIAVDELLLRFARDRLGIPQDISQIDVKDRWQLVFIIDHMSPEVDEMDKIGQWARKNCDRHLMALVERAFSERFVAPLWSQMQQSLLSEKWSTAGKMNEDVGEAIRRLKTAIQSSFTSLSFRERLQLGRTLKEKLDGADKKPRQFMDWIKPLSEKVEASTAELFVSRKNDARHEVEIILSLLTDLKKFEKKNMILELHFRLSHLSASFEPSQIVEVAAFLFEKAANRPITDHFNRYHWHCFRSTFLESWSNYFLLRWSKCNEQTEHLRNVIAGRNPEDDDRSLNSLELALERYLLFTTGLPPLEAVEKWLQLQKQSSPQDIVKFIANDLKLAVREIASTITPRINQLYSNKLLGMTKKEKYVGKDIVALTDVLFEIILGATVPFFDDAESVRSLLVVIEAAQLMMDLITDDAKNTSSQLISSAKLGEWKKKLVQWKILDNEAQSMVHFAVKELVKTAESKSSSEDDCSSREIYDPIFARRRNMLNTFDQALSWLEMFVGYLADSRSGIDTLTVIKATIKSSLFLSCNGLKNEKTSLLRAAIDIFVACTSIPNLSEISWSSFFDAILNLNISEKLIGLITTLANFVGGQLMSSDRKRANWFMARRWVLRLDYLFINHTRRMHDTSRTAADGQNINHWKEMMGIQQVLVDYCSACYETKLLVDSKKCPNKKVDLNLVCFTFKNFVDRWTNIVRFVRPNKKTASSRVGSETEFMIDQLETRQLVLKGLIQLGQSDSFYWDEKTANHFLNGFLIPELDPSPEKVCFLSEMLNGPRKAFVERCVALESCWEPERIRLLEKALRDKNCSLNDAQLFFSITDYDIFNDEEKLYIDLIDDGPSVESALLVDDQHPSSFLGALQKLAIQRFRAEFLRCFEPSITDRDIERFSMPNQNGAPYSQEALADKQHIIQLCRSFNRLIRTKKEQGDKVRDWLLWIRDVVIPSLKSYEAHQGLSVHQIIEFFQEVGEFSLDLCRAATTGCRPHHWIDMLAIFAIKSLLDQLNENCREDEVDIKSSDIVQQLVQWWPSSGAPGSFLHTLYQKIRQEMAGDAIRLMKLVQEVTNRLTVLKLQFHEDDILVSFSNASLNDWPSVMRYAQLAVDWTPDLARRLVSILDVQFGQQRSDHFLRLVVHRHPELKDKSGDPVHLRNILQNLFRCPWIKDGWIALIDEGLLKNSMTVKDSIWNSLSDADIIEKDMRKSSQVDLSVEDIFSIMSRDPESSKVIGNCSEMVERIRRIQIREFETNFDIRKWSNEIKKPNSKSLQVDDFLAVACRVVHDQKGYLPRDVQLIAVAAFVSSDDDRQQDGHMVRRMGQISTGEGKTLISALVAIYHALRCWNEDRHVNIITSSSVLAEANIAEIGWLFKAFGVSVSNNCDQQCSNDEDIRRNRYNNDVIYGDLGSFMRDILLTRFFEDKDVTRNRNPGAIIVDEVDSMTLDKGENVLYMSHNIPEMYNLMRLFVEIWTMVNAPDVVRLAESCDIVDEVHQLIEPMIPTCVPKCLKQFAERHLSTWIKSAFRACYLLKPNDAYKVDDCGDGQGRRIVIMDKETGVEQVQTEWSDGLQQFLQLKHGMKWTPISLKAIFMSNIGYFSEFEGRMYGLTGTLGSAAECELLGQVFGVDFFRLPRFRPRFCLQHEPIIAHDRQNWLNQMESLVVNVASNQQRAVLVVCENIEVANSIYDRLKEDASIKVVKYVSSFDEAFKEKQHQEILPAQVIIATNLAGRGTDLKPSKELLINGGLHVIIGFLPPNSRVEAQAEGRTARSGQPGSYQFVIEKTDEEHGKSHLSGDPYGRMLQLKSKRDEDERLRLDNIRREALPKIQLEEKLFHEYYEKCVRPLNQKSLESFQSFTTASNLEHLQQNCKTITRNCFNNRWALWLDENAGLIEKAHRDPVLADRLSDSFDRLMMSAQSSDVESIVSSPSEWTMLARCYEESSRPSRAAKCYNEVATIEPKWCENALLDRARLTLADNAGYEKKREAKGYLKRARKLIDDRIQVLTSLNQQVDQCLNRQMENGSTLCHKRFEEQVTNQIRLWRIHASKIDNLLGVSLKCALASILPTENDQHIDQVIELLGGCYFMKPRRYSYRKAGENSFDWPPFVAHCREPLLDLVKKKNCKLSDIEDAVGKGETKLWSSLISVYIDEGQLAGGGKMIKADQHIGEIPDTIVSKAYRRILPGWLKFHDGQDFSLVSSTLGIENGDQLKKLEKWLDGEKILQVTEKCFRHRILKSIPSMDQDPDVELLKGVALSSCADVVAAWFSSPVVERNGNQHVLRPLFDERKKKLAKQFLDFLVDVEVLKDPAIEFPSANRERSREDIQQDLDGIKSIISSLNGFDKLAKLFYSKEVTEKAREKEKSKNTLEQNIKQLIPPIVPAFGSLAVAENLCEIFSQLQEAKAIKERRDNLSAALMQAVGIHLGQLKTLAKVKSSFCSLHDALPPAGDDQASPSDEVQQFNNQHLDRVLKVEEYVSRWNWRIGIVALIGVAQLVGAIAFPFFSAGLVGEGINDLMFAFQSITSPGSFSWKSYLVDKAKSLALTAVSMGLGAARLVKACGGSFKQAGKLMCRFNGTLKGWFEAGKQILIQCANMISSSIIGQAVSHFLTWLNKFIREQVLERIKSFVFNNSFLRPAFTRLKDLMKSLMIAIVKSGKSAGEASQKIKEVLDGAKNQLKAGDWFTELRTNASSITSRMMGIFNDSSAGLSSLQGNHVGEYRSHVSSGNTQGITASVNAGTIERAINMGKTIVDYGQKAAEVTQKINNLATNCESVMKLATHGSTYVRDLNAALQDELRALKTKNQQGQSAVGESAGDGLSAKETERFEKFIADTEGEIQSSIMKETLDTIQSAWLQPMIQLKVEKRVRKISSNFVKKYCPSLLPEGANDLKDKNDSKNGADDGKIPTEDQWIDEMGNGKPAGPIEIQNSVDACGYVLELEDKTGQYTQGTEGDKFHYYPEGNPYSDKPVVKMSFTQNEDGTKHVCLIMPDGTKHEYVPDPSEPPNRCFFNALSKAQNDPSVDHTIEKLKNHAKGNDRARFMSKLGVNQSYQHLQAGAYRKFRNGNTIYEVDKLGRTVRIITTETERQQERNSEKKKKIKEELGFQPGDVYSHDVSVNSGGVDEVYNISRMTHECNRFTYREHEENFENFRDYNQQNKSPEVITRVITKHYEHSVGEILRMENEGKYADRYKTKGYQHNFYTGPLEQPTNRYLSGFISNYNGQQASNFLKRNKDSRRMKRTDARRRAANVPFVSGPEFNKFFRNHN